MSYTGKTKFDLKRDIDLFGESKHKRAPDWLDFPDKKKDDIKKIEVRRTMLLDGRKWKMNDLKDGCYAVARYDLKLFATQVQKIEKDLLGEVNKFKGTKYKKIDEILSDPDIGKDSKIKSIFKKSGEKTLKCYGDIVKKIEDKISLALDEVEADKGDNKKSLSSCKEALRKFSMADFKATIREPAASAAGALKSLAAALKDPNKKTAPKEALAAALKAVKEAESDFEKRLKKPKAAVDSVLDLGDKLSNDKNADPAIRNLGEQIGGKSQVSKALEQANDDFDALTMKFDKLRNLISRHQKDEDDETAMKSLAVVAENEAKELTSDAAKCIANIGTAKDGLKKFESEFKSVQKELS